MTKWSPDQYLRFRNERTQPAIDLASSIDLDEVRSVLDVGCGPGTSTRVLRERWPAATVVGLDSSEEMIARARAEYPEQEWLRADAADYAPGRTFDVVFSSATLQWIPDHGRLVPRLFGLVAPGGALAVQVPANTDSPLYRSIVAVAAGDRWRRFTAGASQAITYRGAAEYYVLLAGLTSDFRVWETTYFHPLVSPEALIEWYRSTGLRPYLEGLPDDEARRAFEEDVLAGCRNAYPIQADGKVLFPFRRALFVAYRKSS